jgi:GTP-binding nuclear protein Ran
MFDVRCSMFDVRMYESKKMIVFFRIMSDQIAHKKNKIIVVGDGGVGKTTYVRRYTQGSFQTPYVPTLGVEVVYLSSELNHLPLQDVTPNSTSVWDTAGQEKYIGLRDGYYVGATGAIVMFDVTNLNSFKSVPKWLKYIRNTCGNIPIYICGNKVDVVGRAVSPALIGDFMKKGAGGNTFYQDVSAKSCYNFDGGFKWLKSLRVV